jgi:adenosine deaminase
LKEIAREAGVPIPTRREVRVGPRDPRTQRSFLRKFDAFFNLYPSRDCIERVAREAAEDAAADGLIHLELRFSPVHFARRIKADPVEVTGWIIAAARKGAGRMSVNFIVTLGRHFSASENAPSVDAAIEHRGDVVALDVAGPEDLTLAPFAPLLHRGTLAGLGLTIHAGESTGPESVREALELGASRIGHGVRAATNAAFFKEVERRGGAFEMCLTSNVQSGAVPTLRSHPFLRLLRGGYPVTLNTDDPEVCGTTLSRELKLAKQAGLADLEVRLLQLRAANAAFLSSSDRAQLIQRLDGAQGIG